MRQKAPPSGLTLTRTKPTITKACYIDAKGSHALSKAPVYDALG